MLLNYCHRLGSLFLSGLVSLGAIGSIVGPVLFFRAASPLRLSKRRVRVTERKGGCTSYFKKKEELVKRRVLVTKKGGYELLEMGERF